jgi:hypothetical protein
MEHIIIKEEEKLENLPPVYPPKENRHTNMVKEISAKR